MYVYFFRHSRDARFKIGKANDPCKRYFELGGNAEFLVESSCYIRLNTRETAVRIERVLHKLFEFWNLPVSEGHRFEGDTEQFDLVCWPRVAKFIAENSDLTDGAQLLPLSGIMPAPDELLRSRVQRRDPSRLSAAKALKLEAAIARAQSEFENSIRGIMAGVLVLNSLQLKSCQILSNNDRESKFVFIETQTKADYEAAYEVISEEWSGCSVRPACGRYGFSSIVGTILGWKNRLIRVNLMNIEGAMFAPYRDAIESAFNELRLYGSCGEVELMSLEFDV